MPRLSRIEFSVVSPQILRRLAELGYFDLSFFENLRHSSVDPSSLIHCVRMGSKNNKRVVKVELLDIDRKTVNKVFYEIDDNYPVTWEWLNTQVQLLRADLDSTRCMCRFEERLS